MITAPLGLPGSLLVDPFLRMAQGRNTLSERNTKLGEITHGDGWGSVCEHGGKLSVRRSTRASWDDPEIETLRKQNVFLLHARRASKGSVILDNVHPFEQEIDGARWFFCHSGTGS